MKKKLYFEDEDAEICYPEEHFIDHMKFEGIEAMEVNEAFPDKMKGIFWCKHEGFCGDDSSEACGKQCTAYAPRNGKSGCCKHYTTKIYMHGEKVTLKLK